MPADPKTIAVFLDESDVEGRRIEFANAISAPYRSHTVGIFVETMPAALRSEEASLGFARGAGIDEAARRYFREQRSIADRLRGQLDSGAKQRGVTAEWRHVSAFAPIHDAMVHCLYADLAVLPPYDHLIQKRPWSSADIVVSSGVPAFLVPHAAPTTMPKNVMIAWNASRVSRRALGDALPYLQRAEQVTIVVVDVDHESSSHGEEPGADVARFLAKHGVEVVVDRVSTNGLAVGAVLLQCAQRLGADLVVAGAYGHSRIAEFVLGSTTRAMLGSNDRLFFISH